MKYNKEERLDIGKRIYDNEITKYEAADHYGMVASRGRQAWSEASRPAGACKYPRRQRLIVKRTVE